ncbi:MAG TPA: glycoside hydrolase family 16 protein [Candidatus Eisenbacteria bacterium]|nr:glycoside hydrolase family 16 protein [Candidatus Eisenbacteria bacterium]
MRPRSAAAVKPPRASIRIARVASCLLLLGALSCANRSGPTGPALAPLQISWQDEFDGPAGQSPDSTNWRFDIGTDWGNNQLEYDTARPENASLDGQGHLLIVARREDYLGSAYTSARINTRGLFEQARGRFEARLKLPTGQGLWPAFWLLGANFGTVGWPACGEIDIMEYRGQEPRTVHGSLHGPGYSGGNALTASFQAVQGSFDAGFHVFAVDWDENRITWSVDGIPYRTVTPADLPPGTAWVFDHPFFVILNVAVGGGFVGGPSAETKFPQTMTVDYVRVYAEAP